MKNRIHLITVLFAVVTFIVCMFVGETTFAQDWDWVENFDSGLNGWVNQVPNAWQAINGKLVYSSDISGYGERNIRNPIPVNLHEGFAVDMERDTTGLSAYYGVGIMFGANADMTDVWSFNTDGAGQWHLCNYTPGTTYDYGYGWSPSYPQPHHLSVLYDGMKLDCFVEDTLIVSRNITIPNGYVGVYVWDCGTWPAYASIDNYKFQSVPEPATLFLLGLGAVMLRKYR